MVQKRFEPTLKVLNNRFLQFILSHIFSSDCLDFEQDLKLKIQGKN
jgi:hypothetical protein